MNVTKHIPPTQLWIGTPQYTQQQVIEYLQQSFCKQNTCKHCAACTHIFYKEYPEIMWIRPEKSYTLEKLEPIKHTLSFARGTQEHFFFIIEHADYLSPACSNSLLKILEEPAPGYHFILLAQSRDAIMPTVQSRCIVRYCRNGERSFIDHECIDAFTTQQYTAYDFLQLVEKSALDELMSIALVEQILQFWLEEYKTTMLKTKEKDIITIEKIIKILKQALGKSLMPGSSKLFWKNLFLQYTTLLMQ